MLEVPTLAGNLEKCSRWRKEWDIRFFVLRQDHLDYYLAPPVDIEDEVPRGSISLKGIEAVEEPGRPFCLRVGGHLLSCKNLAEQRRWLEALSLAASACASSFAGGVGIYGSQSAPGSFASSCASSVVGSSPNKGLLRRGRARGNSSSTELNFHAPPLAMLNSGSTNSTAPEVTGDQPPLMLVLPEGSLCALPWREPTTVSLPGKSMPTIFVLDGSGRATSVCQLPVARKGGGDVRVPLKPLLQADQAPVELGSLWVRLHQFSTSGAAGAAADAQQPLKVVVACAVGVVAVWFTVGMLTVLVLLNSVAGVAALLAWKGLWSPSFLTPREVVFSVERLEREAASAMAPLPQWVGRWKLDKARSDPMAPLLEDMGVNILLRKAADAIKSGLDITINSANEVVIGVKTIATVEDVVPLDGSQSTKSAPPGSRIKGALRVSIPRHDAMGFVMLTEFPGDEADMTDTLQVHEDCNAFTRTVERNGIIIRRVFIRDSH